MKCIAILCAALTVFAAATAMAQPSPVPLWPNGAPGPAVAAAPEIVHLSPQGDHIISGIHQPSITPYLPAPGAATGAAVIIAPGGGHKELWIDHEGYRVAEWLSARGVAAFVLKYRLSQEPGSPYSLEKDSLGDIQRAIRLVRSRSAAWHIDPERIGVMGFSAGGELAALAGWRDPVVTGGIDPVDGQSAKPSFEALIYPALPSHGAFSTSPPPTFLLAGDQDRPQISEGVAELYLQIHRARGSVEMHILAGVGHGFGMRDTNPAAVRAWPTLLYNWLDAKGFLTHPTSADISPTLRAGVADAAFVEPYTPEGRAAAAQAILHLAQPPHVGGLISLTPDRPYAEDGASLEVWKPSFVLGTKTGGEIGVNFWGQSNGGHVNLAFTPRTQAAHLLDCRLLSAGTITYKIYFDGAAKPAVEAQAPLVGHHLIVAVPAGAVGRPVLVELWPASPSDVVGIFGCDLGEWLADMPQGKP